jgi:tetratricopeptide (TPR) repeat protein
VIGKPALCTCLLLDTAITAIGCSNQESASSCRSADPDTKIAACTALIPTSQGTTENLFSLYNDRGAAYDDKDEYDRATQDYREAIPLIPNIAGAFYGRGAFGFDSTRLISTRSAGKIAAAAQSFSQLDDIAVLTITFAPAKVRRA